MAACLWQVEFVADHDCTAALYLEGDLLLTTGTTSSSSTGSGSGGSRM